MHGQQGVNIYFLTFRWNVQTPFSWRMILVQVGSKVVGNMGCVYYRGADKSLSRPVRKQAVPFKSVMGRGMD